MINQLRGCIRQLTELLEAATARPAAYWELEPTAIITKRQARELGLSRYRTGKLCPHGHRGWRYTVSGACIQCINHGSPYKKRMHKLALACAAYCREHDQTMLKNTARWLNASELKGITVI